MKRVVVTGASGFIGRAAIPLLKQRGFEVHGLGRRPEGDCIFHEIDLLKPGGLAGLMQAIAPQALLHLAWYVKPKSFLTSPLNRDWIGASLDLLRSFAEAGGRRAVIAGSCMEYEWTGQPLREDSPCNPATLYGAAKNELRQLAEEYAGRAGLSLGWGRIFHLYGPGEKPGRLVSDAILALLAGRRLAVTSGLQRRDFLHVADVAGAFAALLESDVAGPVNIGSGKAVPVRDILNLIGVLTGRTDLFDFGGKPLGQGETALVVADASRLQQEVGFAPQHSLESGIAHTIEWWRARGRSEPDR